MSVVRVELMASTAGRIGGVTWHHLFLVAADASGKQWYLRAGPQCLPLEQIANRTTHQGDALDAYEPPAAGPYGIITVSSGDYAPGGVDFDAVAAGMPVGAANAAAALWDKLQQAAKALGDESIPYEPLGRGANWAIMELLRRCGVAASLPPKRWAPGAGPLEPQPASQSASTRRVGEAVRVAL